MHGASKSVQVHARSCFGGIAGNSILGAWPLALTVLDLGMQDPLVKDTEVNTLEPNVGS